jgi:cell division protein FtsB
MALINTIEERRRKSRNILLSAFLILLFLWTAKLCFPQSTILNVYSQHTESISTSALPPQESATNKGQSASQTENKISLESNSFNGTLATKAAVIVETQFRTNLIPLVLHFSGVLGPSWPILIYTSMESVAQFSASAALNRYLKSGTVQIRMLPQTVLFTNSDSVDEFMTTKWLWEDLAPAKHILIFQSDSMLCANAARSVDDYFAYDFVGAPFAKNFGVGYNGGLSLRKRSTTLNVLEKWDWQKTKKNGDHFEDQWYFNRYVSSENCGEFHNLDLTLSDRMIELQKEEEKEGIQPEEEGAINLPTMEVARTFSVETIDYPHPLGVHQVHRWLKEQMLSLDQWCPEYKLCSEGGIKDTSS